MNTLRIAICEDDRAEAEGLEAMVRAYCGAHQLDAVIECFPSAAALLEPYAPGSFQILLMDILMHGISGMEAALAIRAVDAEVEIIFITVSREYAVESYQAHAAYYLVKPIDCRSLELAMARCRHMLEGYAKSILVPHNRKQAAIRLRDILYVESRRNNCILHTRQGEITSRITLSSLEPRLGGLPFVRCHNSFIVSLFWASGMQGRDFLMKNGAIIPISRSYFPSASQALRQHLIASAREGTRTLAGV